MTIEAPATVQAAEKEVWSFLAEALRPIKRLTVPEWAQQNFCLPGEVTRYPGKIDLALTPYMYGPLLAFTMSRYPKIDLVFAAQTGKTTIEEIIAAYVVDQDPGPGMMVYPTETMTKRRSRRHLQPIIWENEVLKKHLTGNPNDIQLYELTFDKMTWLLSWAGSPGVLAMEPIRYLIRDEKAKFKRIDKEEADPLSLSERRTLSYDWLAKVFDLTTPSLAHRPGWKELMASTWHEYWVPCPHCGDPGKLKDLPHLVTDCNRKSIVARLNKAGYQVLRWPQITGWGKERDPEKVASLAYYKCAHCGKRILDKHKLEITHWDVAKWVPKFPDRLNAGFHLPSWYRDLEKTSFGAVAKRFYEAQGDPEKLQEVVNSDFAEPWQELGHSKSEDEILTHRANYPPGVIPFEPLAVTLAVDVQETVLKYTIRAWRDYEGSALIRYGMLVKTRMHHPDEDPDGRSLSVLEPVMALTFPGPGGKQYPIDFTFPDSGYDTQEVYEFCRRHPNCEPVKGQSQQQHLLEISRPEIDAARKKPRRDSVWLVSFRDDHMKDLLMTKLGIVNEDPGSWWLYTDPADDTALHDYAYELAGERKVQVASRRGFMTWVWKFVHTNDYLDCEKIQCVAARVLGVRERATQAQAEKRRTEASSSDFVTMGRDVSSTWISRHRR